jgi:cell pole-organizing protein PopZ
MAEVKTEQDPSIEEILESIRQIISDDGTESAAAAEAPKKAESAPAPVAHKAPAKEPEPAPQQPMENVLDLTEKVTPDAPAAVAVPAPAPAPAPVPEVKKAEAPVADGDALISGATSDAATAALAKLLAGNVAVERDLPGKVGSVTLEDMVREMMKPLVKTWLDQNLPQVIEKVVQKEIEKLSRRAMDQ